jgi:hypothetical protein
MKKFIIIILAFSFAIISCKKKKQDAPETETVQTGTPDSPYTVSTATAYSGVFTSRSYTTITSASTSTDKQAEAYFSNAPASFFNSNIIAYVNSVSINSGILLYDSTMNKYKNYTAPNSNIDVWNVDGNNGIPSIKYTGYNNAPLCSDYNIIPDSISKSIGFTVNLKGVSNINATGNGFILCDGTFLSSGTVSKTINNGDNTITFTPTELSSLQTSDNGYVTISLEKTSVLNFYGKDFMFTRQNQFYKKVKIKS